MFDFFKSAADNLGTSHFWQLSFLVWSLILLALTFDFLNGLHDAANSIATIVSTRVLSPWTAVVWAAFFNFVAFIIFPLKVATTISGDVVDPALSQDPAYANTFIAATLLAACGWNVLTWWLGLPTSSSHALIGGLVGAAVALTGTFDFIKAEGLGWVLVLVVGGPYLGYILGALLARLLQRSPNAPDGLLGALIGLGAGVGVIFLFVKVQGLAWIVLFIVLAPVTGYILATLITIVVLWLVYLTRGTPQRVDQLFRVLQFSSSAFFSLGHGGNDAQKTMGIIFILLVAASDGGRQFDTPRHVPTEVVLACHVAMGLGTLFGGWRIVKTMGQRISRLRPIDGFCAETGAALVLAFTTMVRGIPISTTHTITGAIVGVGSLKRRSAVRWGVAGQVVWAWVLTIPGSALIAAMCASVLRAF